MNSEITVKILLGDEFLQDILTIAYEGGIGYWCQADATRDEDLNVTDLYNIYDAEDGEAFAKDQLHFLELAKAIEKIINGECNVNTAHTEVIRRAALEDDVCPMDIYDADVIVQVAMFGEIVYG